MFRRTLKRTLKRTRIFNKKTKNVYF